MKKRILLCIGIVLGIILIAGTSLFHMLNQSKPIISDPKNTHITNISTYHKTKYQTAGIAHFIVNENTENEIIEILSKNSMTKTDYNTESIENDQANFVITLMDGNVEKKVWLGKVNLCEVKSESYVGDIENAENTLNELNEICRIVEIMKERDERFGIMYDDPDAYKLIS